MVFVVLAGWEEMVYFGMHYVIVFLLNARTTHPLVLFTEWSRWSRKLSWSWADSGVGGLTRSTQQCLSDSADQCFTDPDGSYWLIVVSLRTNANAFSPHLEFRRVLHSIIISMYKET